jgi:hypothetical protein
MTFLKNIFSDLEIAPTLAHKKYLPSVWVILPSILISSNRMDCFVIDVDLLQYGQTLVVLLILAFSNASALMKRIPILNHLPHF